MMLGRVSLGMSLAYLGVVGAAPSAAQVRDSLRLTLPTAAERALAHYPTVRAARASRDEARATEEGAVAARFPSLRFDAAAVQYQAPMAVTPIHGFAPALAPAFDETLVQAGVTLSYTLFDGGARGALIRGARERAEAAAAALTGGEQALAARVVSVYLEALGKAQVLDAHDRRIAALESELTHAKQRRDVGRAAEVEVLRAEAALANARAERVGLAAALDMAERELARLVGVAPEETRAARLAPVALADSIVPLREELVALARRSNPAVEQAARQRAAADDAQAAARSARWPQLKLVGAYVDRGGGQGDYRAEWNIGAYLSVPLFTAGAISSDISRADVVRRGAEEQVRLAEIRVADDVDRALSAVEEARARVASLILAVDRFAEVARIEQLSLESGAGTQTDFLNAEADLLAARANLAEGRYGEIVARAELAHVTGQLGPAWFTSHLETQP